MREPKAIKQKIKTDMRKIIVLSLMVFAFGQAKAQDFCEEDVVTNLTADIEFGQMQVNLAWDFDTPVTCTICPPFPVYYDIEVEYGMKFFGPSGPISWFYNDVFFHIEPDTEPEHEFAVPIPTKFEYFRYRVKIQWCNDWEDWVETSIWD